MRRADMTTRPAPRPHPPLKEPGARRAGLGEPRAPALQDEAGAEEVPGLKTGGISGHTPPRAARGNSLFPALPAVTSLN